MDHHHHHDEKQPLYGAAAFLGEWMILIATFSIALLFFPLAPSFTLHSTSSSVLNNATNQNNFTASFHVSLLIDDSSPAGSTVQYDALHVSLFHRAKNLSTLSLQEPAKNSVEARFHNVSVGIDEWGQGGADHGEVQAQGINPPSCGFVYLEVWFVARARYARGMWPCVWDTLSGRCGEAKVELCSEDEGITATTTSFLASCDVYSDAVYKVRLALLMVLLVAAVAVPFLVDQFFCSNPAGLSIS